MRVFITQPVARSAIERLRGAAEVELNPDPLHIMTGEELRAAVRGRDVLFCLLHDAVDRDVIAANPKLRGIASMTITPANIDVAEATARRIPVTVIPAMLLDDPTADLAWALILSVGRRLAEADRLVRAGSVPGSQSNFLESGGVSGKILGILGAGGVGRAVARRARGFAMRALYYDPRRLPPGEEKVLGLEWVPFERVFSDSDFVSVHAALTPQTRHLIGAREFALMKPTGYFVNTARGPIVDEAALIRALAERRIAGAGLDVYEHEPDIDPALRALPNVVLTPHIGSAVSSVREAMANVVVDNILALAQGRRPPNCCNPQVYAATA
ncbi:MAG: D-glycerate dehydrogenase [Burkholderiales bacterium]